MFNFSFSIPSSIFGEGVVCVFVGSFGFLRVGVCGGVVCFSGYYHFLQDLFCLRSACGGGWVYVSCI